MRLLMAAVLSVVVLAAGAALWWFSSNDTVRSTNPTPLPEDTNVTPSVVTPEAEEAITAKRDLVRLDQLKPGDTLESPLTLTGEARGPWFFEGSFPVTLTDRNGNVLVRTVATAEGDWMTEEFVPFKAQLDFKSPYVSGDPVFMSHATLVLSKDNPSDLPENDDSLRIPVLLAPAKAADPFSVRIPGPVTIYDGIEVLDNVKALDLSGRGLSGSLKAEIRQLNRLEVLDLSNNDFTGLPAEVGQLSALRRLVLSNNPLTGLPHELGNLSNLEVLDLRGTNYSEADLEVITAALATTTQVLTGSEEEGELETEMEE